MKRLAVIGAGSWGTALAIALAPRFERVALWAYESDLAGRMAATRENDLFLPGFALPDSVCPTASLPAALEDASIVLSVVPSQHVRGIFGQMLPYLRPEMHFVSATKGLELGTLLRMTEVVGEVVRPSFEPSVAVLSGPTFAREVAAGQPAAIVVASDDAAVAASIQVSFSTPRLRLYANSDPVGVELGAALKNVIAIAAGVCQGLELGSNPRAALITRGLAEITRLAVAAGGNPLTLAGLAGLGDLVLTCTGELSRNRQVGIELGRGRKLADVVSSMRMVAEGVKTTEAALALADRLGVDLPIAQQVAAVFAGRSPLDALRELMDRSLKAE